MIHVFTFSREFWLFDMRRQVYRLQFLLLHFEASRQAVKHILLVQTGKNRLFKQ